MYNVYNVCNDSMSIYSNELIHGKCLVENTKSCFGLISIISTHSRARTHCFYNGSLDSCVHPIRVCVCENYICICVDVVKFIIFHVLEIICDRRVQTQSLTHARALILA